MIPLRFGQHPQPTYGDPIPGAPPQLHFIAYTGYEHAPWTRPDMARGDITAPEQIMTGPAGPD